MTLNAITPNELQPLTTDPTMATAMLVGLYVLAALTGYLVGSFPTGYIIVKQMTGQDIRTFGSGSTGTTNVRRVAGKQAALFTLIVDLHKGVIPVVIGRLAFPNEPWVHVLLALFAVIGHSKSIFLKFKGGKSAATGLGGFMALNPLAGITLALIAYAVVKITRYQSVGSITAGVLAPILLYLLGAPMPYVVYALLAATYVILMHKENIKRLLQGTENPL